MKDCLLAVDVFGDFDARERELEVTVVREACVTVDPRVEAVALDYLVAVTGTMVVDTLEDA